MAGIYNPHSINNYQLIIKYFSWERKSLKSRSSPTRTLPSVFLATIRRPTRLALCRSALSLPRQPTVAADGRRLSLNPKVSRSATLLCWPTFRLSLAWAAILCATTIRDASSHQTTTSCLQVVGWLLSMALWATISGVGTSLGTTHIGRMISMSVRLYLLLLLLGIGTIKFRLHLCLVLAQLLLTVQTSFSYHSASARLSIVVATTSLTTMQSGTLSLASQS